MRPQKADSVGEPATARLLARWHPTFDFDLRTAFQKDSADVTDADREQLAALQNGRAAKAEARKMALATLGGSREGCGIEGRTQGNGIG